MVFSDFFMVSIDMLMLFIDFSHGFYRLFFFHGVHPSLVFTHEHVECRSRHNRVGCIQFHWVVIVLV